MQNFSRKENIIPFEKFYEKYFSDSEPRTIRLGINPGRFGAGITGISFTDGKTLLEKCKIENDWDKRYELSAVFVYEMIEAFGGIDAFYKKYFITSVVPLGFVKNGKNINYYDDKGLLTNLKKYIVRNFNKLSEMRTHKHRVIVLGQGKNFDFMRKLNDEYGFYQEVVSLPHPRWVLQYKRKEKDLHIAHYLEVLSMG